jgi:hypothetical protein
LAGRNRAVAILIATATTVLASPAWATTPTTGVYGGVIDGTNYAADPCGNRHNEGEGYFRAKKTTTGRKIVPPGDFAGCQGPFHSDYIIAPSAGPLGSGAGYPVCDPYNAALDADRIPISQGAFDFSGYTAQISSRPRYHIRFKGSWVSQTKVKGFTRITKGTCDTGKMPWTMKIVATS